MPAPSRASSPNLVAAQGLFVKVSWNLGFWFSMGRLVARPRGEPVLLSFANTRPDGSFAGVLNDPVAVAWDGDVLRTLGG